MDLPQTLQLKTHCLWQMRQPLKNTLLYLFFFKKAETLTMWTLEDREWPEHYTGATNQKYPNPPMQR